MNSSFSPTGNGMESCVEQEMLEWYRMSPGERWQASQILWSEYLALGGSLEPEVDFQSPFYTAEEYAEFERHHQDKLRQAAK
jgi:hypothetical protein